MSIGVISDASPIIYFAKMGQLDLLVQVMGVVGVPPAVHREAVEVGQRHGRPDASRIAKSLARGDLVHVTLTEQESQLSQTLQARNNLGPGESETIACAYHRNAIALLHDKRARRVAGDYQVSTRQAVDVLFMALLRRFKAPNEFVELLRRLAVLTGMDAATLMEREALAAEIAKQLARHGGDNHE
jgi:predicted nucleic acid-binding protein